MDIDWKVQSAAGNSIKRNMSNAFIDYTLSAQTRLQGWGGAMCVCGGGGIWQDSFMRASYSAAAVEENSKEM